MTTETNAMLGAVQNGKDSLVREFKSGVDNAQDLMNDVSDASSASLASARSKVQDKLISMKARLDDARSRVSEQARVAADATQDYVREKPWQVLAGAAAVGLLLGLLIRRR